MGEQALNILIVDDEPDHRELIRDVLEHEYSSSRVTEVETAEQALLALAGGPYEAVILDYMLPGRTALDLLPEVLAVAPDIAVIVTTARGDEQVAAAAIRGGAADYVVKGPNLATRLSHSLEQALQTTRLRVQARAAEAHVAHLNSVLQAIRKVNQLITKGRDRDALLQQACEALVQTRGYEAAGVALISREGRPLGLFSAGLGETEQRLRSRIEAGQWPDYITAALETSGIVRLSPPQVRPTGPSRFDQMRVLSTTLACDSTVYGVIAVAVLPDRTDDRDEQALFLELATDLGYALRSLELEQERSRAEADLTQLNRLYAALLEIGEIMLRQREPAVLLTETCRLAVDSGGFAMAWIAMVAADGRVEPAAHWGDDRGFLDEVRIRLADGREAAGPTAVAIREDRYVIVEDVSRETRELPWVVSALQRGYLSAGAFPLRVGGRATGALVLYAERPHFFDEQRVGLLQTLAGDLSLTLEALRREQQRREAEQALRESEERFRGVIEQAPVGLAIARGETLLYANRALLQMLGYDSLEEIPGQQVLSLFPPEVRDEVAERRRRRTAEVESYDAIGLTRDGRRMPQQITVARLTLPDGPAIIAFHIDLTARRAMEDRLRREITEREQAQEQLLVQQADLRLLATELSLAEERERRRVATQLHDSVVQLLAAAKMHLGLVAATEQAAPFRSTLSQVQGILQQALSRSRSLMYELSASALYELGFGEALEALVQQFRGQEGLTISLERDEGPLTLDPDLQVVLFQAERELLNNIVVHAHATEVHISLRRDDGQAELSTRDNGLGFDAAGRRAGDDPAIGFGLFSIRQRLRHFDGTVEVDSRPGEGTTVTLRVPLHLQSGGADR